MSRNCYIFRMIVVVAGLAAIMTPVQAEPEGIILVTETWPPFRIASGGEQHGGYTGIDIDLLKLMAEKLNMSFTVQHLPWARCLEYMRAGDADLISGLAHTNQRAKFIRYSSKPYYSVSPIFYTTKGSGHLVQKYEDLYQYRIGYSTHSAYFEPFNSDTKLKKVGVATEKQLLKMLVHGHLDIIIGTNPNLAYDVAQKGLKKQVEKTTYMPPQKTDLFIGISKKSKLMSRAKELDAILEKLIDSGAVNRLAAKYF